MLILPADNVGDLVIFREVDVVIPPLTCGLPLISISPLEELISVGSTALTPKFPTDGSPFTKCV